MSADPADYPHRRAFLSLVYGAQTVVCLLPEGSDPEADMLDEMRDCIASRSNLVLAAKDTASLALAEASFRRLVASSPADPVS